MDAHLDWLSWTMELTDNVTSVGALGHHSHRLLSTLSGELHELVYNGLSFDTATGRPPYRYALARADNGVRVFGGGALPNCLLEISGKGCKQLYDEDLARAVVAAIGGRITRMDYAVDIRTAVTPSVFANARRHQSFRSTSWIKSDTGETVYIGSPKSDRFARVYRYNPPHPRSKLLRVEFVFRRQLAKATSQQYLDTASTQEFVAALGNTWGFGHPVWKPRAATNERVRVPIVSREDESTVRWLYTQVAPAMRRLMEAGGFDPYDFWEFVMGGQKDPE